VELEVDEEEVLLDVEDEVVELEVEDDEELELDEELDDDDDDDDDDELELDDEPPPDTGTSTNGSTLVANVGVVAPVATVPGRHAMFTVPIGSTADRRSEPFVIAPALAVPVSAWLSERVPSAVGVQL
jgi:hypothetical protein